MDNKLSVNNSKTLYGFTLTPDIQKKLHILWYNRKTMNNNPKETKDVNVSKDNIMAIFDYLDKKKVPFNIQKKILKMAEKGESFEDFIETLEAA